MLKIENTEVMGWEAAIRGMRNPMNSWEMSDSGTCATHGPDHCSNCMYGSTCHADPADIETKYIIGPNDLDLMKRLRNAGTDHRKFMRMITVYCDITAPLYWWKEFDTYKVGTVANSCSTMHKVADKEFVVADFSVEHLIGHVDDAKVQTVQDGTFVTTSPFEVLRNTIGMLNECRDRYLQTKDKLWWWQMIQLLPTSYNQRRTIMLNYEILTNIYKSRRNHKLDEWHTLCDWIDGLPYAELITGKHDS